jgi:DNA-binding LacI/PurR family transcriptional regulator
MSRTNHDERPTLATVAKHVGVSRMTVSNAFNRPDQLSPALRERVLEAARGLGYQGPDPLARTLARGRTGSLGVVFDYSLTEALTDPAASGVLLGVARECELRSLGLTLVPLLSGADETHVRTALVDGFVLYSVTRNDARLRAVQDRGLPYVLVDHEPSGAVPRVNIDDRGAARAMALHLTGLGHRRIGLVMGWEHTAKTLAEAQEQSIYFVGAERLAGWREGLEAAGLDGAVPVASAPAHGRETGRIAGHRLLDRAEPPTAVLTFSDLLALGVMDAAAERGVDVPSQLSVIGFDDVAEAAAATPPLTTVRQPHDEKGAAAVRLLLDPDDRDSVLLPAELIVRSSTAPPPPQEGPPCS